ncbi:hypothetical protein ACLB1R_00315 [Escherichia coli]
MVTQIERQFVGSGLQQHPSPSLPLAIRFCFVDASPLWYEINHLVSMKHLPICKACVVLTSTVAASYPAF